MMLQQVAQEIRQLTWELVAISICYSHKDPAIRDQGHGVQLVTITGDVPLSIGMSLSEAYHDTWRTMEASGVYHLRLIDGALVQMLYTFKDGTLIKHRLAFYPPPRLHSFDGEPELYEDDEIYGDIVGEGLAHVPMRFDFSADDQANCPIDHPVSHLTLGQYPNCRIPVSAPLSPRTFMGFILRSFYHRAYKKYQGDIHLETHTLPRTLVAAEAAIHHIAVPSHTA